MYRIVPILLFFFIQISIADAQRMDHLRGELLVQLKTNASAERLAARFAEVDKRPTFFALAERLSQNLNIWRFTYNPSFVGEQKILSLIDADPQVIHAQFNHFIKFRSTIPNDPLFDNQWQYINTGTMGGVADADLDMELAWGITTGGVTALGDTIVVCVIDGGIDLLHQDFEDNLWVNHAEIPNNDIDDDNNGYVDDFRGWNTGGNNDNINGDNHGTAVAGIIGAKGNNNLGISGISWNVKVMVVRASTGTEAAVIAAYDYPLTQRKIYNTSEGNAGAFVVATNASWGIDGGMASDAPIWCSFYDTLGRYGIINCGATINANENVEEFGDLPTTCPSDYLISVTNIRRNNVKETEAGYGNISIDLGAFGTDVYTTSIGNNYSSFGGTSGATPQVTGTIGLLYSVPCESIALLARQFPEACALLMKEAVLESAVSNESLQGITVTEGQLNTNDALLYLMDLCDGCFRPSVLRAMNVTDEEASLSWAQTGSVINSDLRWRPVGSNEWNDVLGVANPYLLTGLTACTEYEFQVKSHCSEDESSFSASQIFKTDGCCEPPQQTFLQSLDATSATVAWTSVLAATSYFAQFRETGTISWNNLLAFENSYTFNDLESCTEYEYRIGTNCGVASGGFTPVQSFRTTDCGACADANYCDPMLLEPETDWLESFTFGDINNPSGNDGGYGNFSLLGTFVFEKGQVYPFSLTPGYSGFAYTEKLTLWMDFNKNEIFDDDEIIYTTPDGFNAMISGNVEIPPNVETGETRLRVGMMFMEVTGPCPSGTGVFGEFEDYCVDVIEAQGCVPVRTIDTTGRTLHSLTIHWTPITVADNYTVAYRKKGESSFSENTTFAEQYVLTNLDKCSEYEVRITTNCQDGSTIESEIMEVSSGCDVSTTEISGIRDWRISPNPFRDKMSIKLYANKARSDLELEVYNPFGQKIAAQKVILRQGDNYLDISADNWVQGVYFATIFSKESGERSVLRVVRVE